ncbi:MAG: hypothetical protein JW864_15755 [Spirochaetes bacterium]|nr:hypothetical protein [Spirochaetota bacterium]
MRYKTVIIALFFLGVFLACGSKEDKSTAKQDDVVTLQDFAYSQKNEFIKTMQSELNRINLEVKELETNAKNLKEEALSESKQKIQALRDQTDKLNKQIVKAKNATESTWDGVKNDFNKSYSEFMESFGQVRTWMSEKIAP